MKLARYLRDGRPQVAVVRDGTLVDVPGATSMVELLEAGGEGAARARAATGAGPPVDGTELLAPVEPRRNLFCVGWNYLPHFEEGTGRRGVQEVGDLPDRPTFFTKATTTVTGPHSPIPLHAGVTERLDWEAELAVVIGRAGSDVAEASALDHVAAYTAGNDVSARELQRAHGGQWFKGKSLDGTCPLGPWLVTADELGDPHRLGIACRVNGVTKQESTTASMVFTVARIVAELSRGLTLLPGDVILTGTPEGTGFARTPPEFLAAGDLLETAIEAIGTLRNQIDGGSHVR